MRPEIADDLFMYSFEIFFKDGRTQQNDYTLEVDEVACIRFIPLNPGLHPDMHFFFTEGNLKLERFFGRGFVTTGKGKDYVYCIFTESCNIYVNAYTGDVTMTDNKEWKIKSRLV